MPLEDKGCWEQLVVGLRESKENRTPKFKLVLWTAHLKQQALKQTQQTFKIKLCSERVWLEMPEQERKQMIQKWFKLPKEEPIEGWLEALELEHLSLLEYFNSKAFQVKVNKATRRTTHPASHQATTFTQQKLISLTALLPGCLGEEAGGDLAEKIDRLRLQGDSPRAILLKLIFVWLPPIIIGLLKVKWHDMFPTRHSPED